MKRDSEEHELEIDALTGDEIIAEESDLSLGALKLKLKELRSELAETKKERDEHLAGWQRAKADLVNFRRNVEEDRVRDTARLKGKVVRTILPVLDSFTSAMADKGWGDVDEKWRDGVERIKGQLDRALETEGVSTFGGVGDRFDPQLHECIGVAPAAEQSQDDTIAQVLQQGYLIDGEVIRPAKVIVFQS